MNQPWQRDRDLDHLHPTFRQKVEALLNSLGEAGLPFRLFEGFRSPHRQKYLYAQGRTRPGNIVTYARPWSSNHQYGVAADFVLYEGDSWSWDTSGEKDRWWQRLHELGREHGLEPLSWELPHLQLVGLDTDTLREGKYPPAGDRTWAENLEAGIYSWPDPLDAPPIPDVEKDRPPLDVSISERLKITDELVSVGSAGWHNAFEGCQWRYDDKGVYVRDHDSGRKPLRTRGEPITGRTIWSLFADIIVGASKTYAIPPTLIMMVLATETAFARNFGFSGPRTFRWEPHVKVKDVSPPIWGDYSAGPMQTLATTARWIIRKQALNYDPFSTAPVFERQPEPPDTHPLYEPATNIDIGIAEIRERYAKTGDDPILVAAAYNAGGVYKSTQNPWHLKTFGDHLDRAARWYGDACAVLKEQNA
jgi:peptidoglycan L-alanyl-D-glutamate endopeptidase CwlK